MKQFVLSINPKNTDIGSESELILTNREFHYLIHVRRHSSGDSIPALSPDGRIFKMRVLNVGKKSCTVGITQVIKENSETNSPFPRITLMPALTRGRKMDLVVRQAVEGGAFAIWPVLTENCQVTFRKDPDTSGKRERWHRITVEALQQCGGKYSTQLETPGTMADILETWNRRGPLFFLHEQKSGNKEPNSLHRYLAEPLEDLAIMIGPEGGFSPVETDLLRDFGGKPVYLGRRVLRAETAAIYGLAAISTIIRESSEWQTV